MIDATRALSFDGTRLSCWERGSGPLLLLVHGSGTDHRCFEPVVGLFADYRVLTYDRRGHGLSDGEATADTTVEVGDLRSLLGRFASEGEPVFILAYSYGALITLQALNAGQVAADAVTLYEPPMSDPDLLSASAEVVRLVRQGAYDAAMRLFVETTFHVPPRAVEAMRRGPMWKVAIQHASTLPVELDAVATTPVPTLPASSPPLQILIAADGGNPAFHRIAEQIQSGPAACRIDRVPGLPHFAMATNPAEFAAAVNEFLCSP